MKKIIPTSWNMICPILDEYMTDELARDLYPDNIVMYYDDRNFIDWSGYVVNDGVYKFYNRDTMLKFMRNYGITCGCERRTINNKVKFFYNNKEMTEQQYNFIRKRADSLGYRNNKGCECGKNQG